MHNFFSKKDIAVEVLTDSGTTYLSGLPMTAVISNNGGSAFPEAFLTIEGLSLEQMRKLTFTKMPAIDIHPNYSIRVYVNGSLIFTGTIWEAYANFNSAPNIQFNISAIFCLEAASGNITLPGMAGLAPEFSAKGEITGEELIQVIKSRFNKKDFVFDDPSYKSKKLKNVHLAGSPAQELAQAMELLGAEAVYDRDVITIKKPGIAMNREAVFLSDENGLIGYPSFSNMSLTARCIFEPQISMSAPVRIRTVVPKVSEGQFFVTSYAHRLSANRPNGGPWETTFSAHPETATWGKI